MSVEVGTAWKARSAELAEWAFTKLANRFDGWGQYTRDGKSFTAKGELTRGLLNQHFAGATTLGLHNVAPDQWVKWCVWDFDLHEEYDEGKAQENLNQALLVERTLAGLGATALIHDSNGKGGFHVWLFFDKPRLCWDVYAWGREFGKNLELLKHEFYPKQARINEWGNFVRLFGRHHKRDHWSRFLAPPNTWLEGDEAIEWLLEIPECDVDALIPETTSPVAAPPLPAAARSSGPRPDGLANIDRALQADQQRNEKKAVENLWNLPQEWRDTHDLWIKVGQSLHSVDPSLKMLSHWDMWSSQSAKYEVGECAKRWGSFNANRENGLGLGSLIQWAREALQAQTTPEEIESGLFALSELLSKDRAPIVVTDILRHGEAAEATFTLVLDGHKELFLGQAGDVKSFNKVDNAFCGATGEFLSDELKENFKKNIAGKIVKFSRLIPVGIEQEQTQGWLDMAIHHQAPLACDAEHAPKGAKIGATEEEKIKWEKQQLEAASHDKERVGFTYRGITYLRMIPLLKFVKMSICVPIDEKQMGRRLTQLGYKKIRRSFLGIEIRVFTKESGTVDDEDAL